MISLYILCKLTKGIIAAVVTAEIAVDAAVTTVDTVAIALVTTVVMVEEVCGQGEDKL